MNETKPTAYYDSRKNSFIEIGFRAYVFSFKSPKSGKACYVSTSIVLSIDSKSGCFETMNTMYTPGDD